MFGESTNLFHQVIRLGVSRSPCYFCFLPSCIQYSQLAELEGRRKIESVIFTGIGPLWDPADQLTASSAGRDVSTDRTEPYP